MEETNTLLCERCDHPFPVPIDQLDGELAQCIKCGAILGPRHAFLGLAFGYAHANVFAKRPKK